MKVLIICSNDTSGGAAIASYRLHKGFLAHGVSSTMIVQKKHSNDETVVQCSDEWNGMSHVYERMHLLPYPHKSETLFSSASVSNLNLIKYINDSDCDIVHLHWINNGFIKISDLLNLRKPIVWTLHDMWPFTGGCHYDEECSRFKQSCGLCKVLNSNNVDDLSSRLFTEKKLVYSLLKSIYFIGLSEWVANEAAGSGLLKGKKVATLPNLLDNNVYHLINKQQSREFLGLPLDKKIILFGAVNSTRDVRKGFSFFKGLTHLLREGDCEFLVFGNSCNSGDLTANIHYLGHVSDEEKLANIYSAADILVVPSLQENLANIIMEGLFCGVPVVTFNIGGNSDLVEHKVNGYLAQPFSIANLYDGIVWCLKNEKQLSNIKISKMAQGKFSPNVVVPRYMDFYTFVLNDYYDNNDLVFHDGNRLKFIPKHIEQKFNHLAKQKYKYVVYGCGSYGQAMLDYFPNNIVAFVDKGCARVDTEISKHEVYSPGCLKNMSFDKVIIGALGYEDEIESYLVNELNIDKDKVIRII